MNSVTTRKRKHQSNPEDHVNTKIIALSLQTKTNAVGTTEEAVKRRLWKEYLARHLSEPKTDKQGSQTQKYGFTEEVEKAQLAKEAIRAAISENQTERSPPRLFWSGDKHSVVIPQEGGNVKVQGVHLLANLQENGNKLCLTKVSRVDTKDLQHHRAVQAMQHIFKKRLDDANRRQQSIKELTARIQDASINNIEVPQMMMEIEKNSAVIRTHKTEMERLEKCTSVRVTYEQGKRGCFHVIPANTFVFLDFFEQPVYWCPEGTLHPSVAATFEQVTRKCVEMPACLRCQSHFEHMWGKQGQRPGQFHHPAGIAVFNEEVFVTDHNHRVSVFDLDGGLLRSFGSHGLGPGQFIDPAGISVSGSEIFVADYPRCRIQVFNLQGDFLRMWGSKGKARGQFIGPNGIAATENEVYVTDYLNRRVQVFSRQGQPLRSWGDTIANYRQDGQLYLPIAVAVCEDSQHVFIADSGNHRVQVFTTEGQFVRSWGSAGAGLGHFANMHSIAVSGQEVFVTDNHCLQVFSREGVFLRSLDSGAGSGEGQLEKSYGVAVHETKLFVTDYTNNRVQVFQTKTKTKTN